MGRNAHAFTAWTQKAHLWGWLHGFSGRHKRNRHRKIFVPLAPPPTMPVVVRVRFIEHAIDLVLHQAETQTSYRVSTKESESRKCWTQQMSYSQERSDCLWSPHLLTSRHDCVLCVQEILYGISSIKLWDESNPLPEGLCKGVETDAERLKECQNGWIA